MSAPGAERATGSSPPREAPDATTTLAVVAAAAAVVIGWEAAWFGELVWGGLELVPVAALALVMRTGGWRWWVELLSRREAATGLALMRMLLGIVVFTVLGGMWARGVIDMLWVDVDYGGTRDLGNGTKLIAWLGGPTPTVIWGLVYATMAASVCLTLGFGTRLMAFVVMWGWMSLTDVNGHAGGSYDELAKNELWLLTLGACTRTLSLDAKLRTGSWVDSTPVAAWPRYLAILQLVLTYSTTGWQKLSAHWVPGGGFSALYYIFQQPTWQRFDMTWVAWFYPLTQFATALTWFWEVGTPIVLLAYWYRNTRTRPGWVRAWFNSWDMRAIWALIGLSFHVFLTIFMDVGPFTPITLSFYFCLVHPDEYAAFWRRIVRGRPPYSTSSQTSCDIGSNEASVAS